MLKRLPLLLTLAPLAVAIGVYWLFWTGWAAEFKAALAPWLPGTGVVVTGFPYRLEAEIAPARLDGGDVVKLSARASRARINRGPWRPELTLISAQQPEFAATVGDVLSARLAAASSITSVHVDADGHVARISTVADAARIATGLLPVPITAQAFEVHLRERVGETAPASSPSGAPRGQMVLAGTALRFGGGDPLTFAADMVATGPARLDGYDRWATTGMVAIDPLTLADATGEVARVRATLVPIGRTGARFAGTIETVCPATVAAAIAGTPAPSERRLRAPARLAFEGVPGAVRVTGIPADLTTRAVRAQLPPCPVLRR
ncbi:hypothetical protein IP88_14905 [alpha proteobacterium AAP81b]|nr:hypothetical protein IP88_14905 [alpha proteobacterium AAP81b]